MRVTYILLGIISIVSCASARPVHDLPLPAILMTIGELRASIESPEEVSLMVGYLSPTWATALDSMPQNEVVGIVKRDSVFVGHANVMRLQIWIQRCGSKEAIRVSQEERIYRTAPCPWRRKGTSRATER